MRKRVVFVLFMLLAVAALLFIVSCPEESTVPRDQEEDELTIESITIVDKGDGVTLVTLPAVGQTLQVKIKLSDGTYVDTESDDIEITYKWFHKENSTITLSTDSFYEVTEDSQDKTIRVTVAVEELGEATWEAATKIVGISMISIVDGADGITTVFIPEVGQVLRANIELSDGTKIYTHPADPRVSYAWVYAESSSTILGTEGSYTVTRDNAGKTIALLVTVDGIGEGEWVADSPVVAIEKIEIVDGDDGVTPVLIPKVNQVIRANIKLTDGSYIYTSPVDPRVSYEWFYAESDDTILGTDGSYTVTIDNSDKTISVRVNVTGLGEATWEADGKVIEPIEYNGSVSGPIVLNPVTGYAEVQLTGAYDVLITGPPSVNDGGNHVFVGTISGDINGNVSAEINPNSVDTLYAVITDTDATDEVRFVGYLDEDENLFMGQIITGPPKEPVTSIVVKDSLGNTNLSVKEGEPIQLIAEISPTGATTTVYWHLVGGGGANEIDKKSGEFTANAEGTYTVRVKTYDDINLSMEEVTITVTP